MRTIIGYDMLISKLDRHFKYMDQRRLDNSPQVLGSKISPKHIQQVIFNFLNLFRVFNFSLVVYGPRVECANYSKGHSVY